MDYSLELLELLELLEPVDATLSERRGRDRRQQDKESFQDWRVARSEAEYEMLEVHGNQPADGFDLERKLGPVTLRHRDVAPSLDVDHDEDWATRTHI